MNKSSRLTTTAITSSLLLSALVAPSAAFATPSEDSTDVKTEIIVSTDAPYDVVAETAIPVGADSDVALLSAQNQSIVRSQTRALVAKINKTYNTSVRAAAKLPTAAARKAALAKAKLARAKALKNVSPSVSATN